MMEEGGGAQGFREGLLSVSPAQKAWGLALRRPSGVGAESCPAHLHGILCHACLVDTWESRVSPSPQPVLLMSPEQEAGLGPLALDIGFRVSVHESQCLVCSIRSQPVPQCG